MRPDHQPIRVLFLGGKAVGCGVLQQLIYSPLATVCGVFVNSNDMLMGRWFPSVAEISLKHNIPSCISNDINGPDEVEWIKRLSPDIIIVAYFDQILSRSVFTIPMLGSVNLHLALAEKYRGCYPTTWAIINGENYTGVTLHRICEDIDGGDILAESEVLIELEDTGLSLYQKCTNSGIALFADVLPKLLRGELKGRPQVSGPETKYYKRDFPSHEIKLQDDSKTTINRIRALHFPPFPHPYIILNGRKFVILPEIDDAMII